MRNVTILITFLVSIPLLSFSQEADAKLYKKLTKYCKGITAEFDQIPEQRKAELKEFGEYIYEKRIANEPANITVICTHNSRRSHMGQLWLYAAAAWYGFEDVRAFSGGTEATAFNPRAVDALKRAGFGVVKTTSTENPTYKATFLRGRSNQPGIIMFSKKYGDSQNPNQDFAAVMVCSDADKSCPVVPGADARFSFPFDDPRYFDGTPSEEMKYDETSRLIAREMFFAMNHAKELWIVEQEKLK